MKNVCSFSEWIATCSQKPNIGGTTISKLKLQNRKSRARPGAEREFDLDSFEKHDKFQM